MRLQNKRLLERGKKRALCALNMTQHPSEPNTLCHLQNSNMHSHSQNSLDSHVKSQFSRGIENAKRRLESDAAEGDETWVRLSQIVRQEV